MWCAHQGFRRDGVVHVSQLLDRRVEKPEEVVDINDAVWVKVGLTLL